MSDDFDIETDERATERKRKDAGRSEKLRQKYRDAGFSPTVVNIAPGTRGEVQAHAYKVAEKQGIHKP